MDIDVRTRAFVTPDAGGAIVEVATEVAADQVLMGWNGTLARDDHVFGATLDPVLADAPCDVSLVEIHSETVGRPVTLAGAGPDSPKQPSVPSSSRRCRDDPRVAQRPVARS